MRRTSGRDGALGRVRDGVRRRGPPGACASTRAPARGRRRGRSRRPTWGSRAGAPPGGPEGRGHVAGEVVEAQGLREALARGRARHHHLLERLKRSGLARAHGEVSQHGGEHDQPGVPRGEEEHRREHAQPGQPEQRRARAPALGRPLHGEGERRAREQGQGHGESEPARVQSEPSEIDGHEHAERTVGERARGLGHEDQPGVSGQGHARDCGGAPAPSQDGA